MTRSASPPAGPGDHEAAVARLLSQSFSEDEGAVTATPEHYSSAGLLTSSTPSA